MAPAIGLVLTKKFTYRGNQGETWSNKYWFTGNPPGPAAEWRVLFDQLVDAEKTVYSAGTEVVSGYGYNDDTPGAHAVWSVDLELLGQAESGSLLVTAGNDMAGDQAGMIEWQTQRKNSRGKWIYLRKYFHGGGTSPSVPDDISTETRAAYDTLVQSLLQGTWSPGHIIRSQKQAETFNWGASSQYVTTRTLKRRGKRP